MAREIVVRSEDNPQVVTSGRWLIVLSIVLTVVTAALAVSLGRANIRVRALQDAEVNARLEREALEARLAREQSTREALSLELTRQRNGARGDRPAIPTLTLTPGHSRGGAPPEPTVAAPPSGQVIELRLMLPKGAASSPSSTFEVVVRSWSSGQTIWSRGDLRVRTADNQPAVMAYITSDVLVSGAYEVMLNGEQGEVAYYDIGVR